MPTALITGASTGIGKATALRLAGAGWTVLAGVRSPAAGEALVAEVPLGRDTSSGRDTYSGRDASSERLTPIQLDITDPAQIAATAELVAQRTGVAGLDALVNNAGVAAGGPLEMLPLAQVRELMEVNFFGQLAVTQALIPALRLARGRIVLLSSIGGLVPTPYMSPFLLSKSP